ncbi:TVP38/TMEM64 family protein [Pokkaliibacter sp. CJK22405]|uniref:TVP38/TMEM64 family protein n=1 Tax=Pokkaliibacter sp. CJK22405 TaxID=3384615 RepID=UPI0039854E93
MKDSLPDLQPSSSGASMAKPSSSLGAALLSGLILLAIVMLYFLVPGIHDRVNEGFQILTSNDNQRIQAWVQDFGLWGPLLIILAMVVQMFLIVLPSLMLMVVAVLAYGPVLGSLISTVAVLVASLVGYAIGRRANQALQRRVISPATQQRLQDYMDAYGLWAVIIFRVCPFLSNDAISLVAGVVGMGLWRFSAATLIGILPLVILIGIFGEDTESLERGLLWMTALSVVIFGVYMLLRRRLKRQQHNENAPA